MNFSVYNFGCKVNQYESQVMTELMIKSGYTYTDDKEKADIIIINSCTVTAVADNKVLKLIRHIKRENPEINVGISPQYLFVNYKGNVHSLLTMNLSLEADTYRLMAGMGQAFTKWGFMGRNSNKAFGYNVALGLTTESSHTPWVEGDVFILKNGYWEFYGRPYYLSASMFFREADPYIVYQKK